QQLSPSADLHGAQDLDIAGIGGQYDDSRFGEFTANSDHRVQIFEENNKQLAMKLKTIPCRNRGRSSTARIRIELGRYSSLHQVFLLRFTFPISKSDLLVSISLLLVRKSDFLVSISLLLVRKSDLLASVSLLLVSKSDFLVADELASFSDDLSTERAHWLHPFNLTCSWSRVRFVPK